MRKKEFFKNGYYHIFNRGTEKRKIFLDKEDYLRFCVSMDLLRYDRTDLMDRWRDYCKSKPNANLDEFRRSNLRNEKMLVKFVAYCLNPNHYHFELEQIEEKGVEKYMQKLGTSYTMYFNKKYDRSGVLFQGKFKASLIKSNAFLYISVYINCNSEVHGIAKAENYHWCSFPEYIGKKDKGLCNEGRKIILTDFNSYEDYKKFALENVKYFQKKKLDEKTVLE